MATSARLLKALLQKGAAPNKDTYSAKGFLTYIDGNRFGKEKPNNGLSNILGMTSRFVFAYPEHFASLVPLMVPKIRLSEEWGASFEVENILKKELNKLFDGCYTGDTWEFPEKDFRGLFQALRQNRQMGLLRWENRQGVAISSFASFLQRAPIDVKAAACDMLCAVDSATAGSIVTHAMLGDLPDPHHQKLCVALLPIIHTLSADTKAALLAEVRATDAAAEAESFEFQPKRPRIR